MNYQEEAETNAWQVLRSDANEYAKAAHALTLIEAHYRRARKDLDQARASFRRKVHGRRYSRLYELDIDVYTRHWLWANGDLLPSEVLPILRDCWYYEAEEHKMLPKGASMYVDCCAFWRRAIGSADGA